MNQIQKLETWKKDLALAETFEEIKLHDSAASAAAEFARREKLCLEKQNEIGRFRVLVETQKGKWLDENFKHGRNQFTKEVEQDDLHKMPVSKDESSRARKIKNTEEEKLKQIMHEIEERGEVITPNKVHKEIRKQENTEEVFVAATEKDILQKAKEIKAKKAEEYKQKIVDRIENKVSETKISKEEKELIEKLSNGETIVININKHFHVLKEAKERGLYYQIDRYSAFGNPFFLDTDGDREQVCDGYIEYFKHKRSLHEKVKELKGKALGCHCAPLRCHGDHLKSLADEN
jgi:DNA polymerase III delta prime subunit